MDDGGSKGGANGNNQRVCKDLDDEPYSDWLPDTRVKQLNAGAAYSQYGIFLPTPATTRTLGRKAGLGRVPNFVHRSGSLVVPTLRGAWRSAVSKSATLEELMLKLRVFDAALRWDVIKGSVRSYDQTYSIKSHRTTGWRVSYELVSNLQQLPNWAPGDKIRSVEWVSESAIPKLELIRVYFAEIERVERKRLKDIADAAALAKRKEIEGKKEAERAAAQRLASEQQRQAKLEHARLVAVKQEAAKQKLLEAQRLRQEQQQQLVQLQREREIAKLKEQWTVVEQQRKIAEAYKNQLSAQKLRDQQAAAFEQQQFQLLQLKKQELLQQRQALEHQQMFQQQQQRYHPRFGQHFHHQLPAPLVLGSNMWQYPLELVGQQQQSDFNAVQQQLVALRERQYQLAQQESEQKRIQQQQERKIRAIEQCLHDVSYNMHSDDGRQIEGRSPKRAPGLDPDSLGAVSGVPVDDAGQPLTGLALRVAIVRASFTWEKQVKKPVPTEKRVAVPGRVEQAELHCICQVEATKMGPSSGRVACDGCQRQFHHACVASTQQPFTGLPYWCADCADAYYIADENEMMKSIAHKLGVGTKELVDLNKFVFEGLSATSRLVGGTALLIPGAAPIYEAQILRDSAFQKVLAQKEMDLSKDVGKKRSIQFKKKYKNKMTESPKLSTEKTNVPRKTNKRSSIEASVSRSAEAVTDSRCVDFLSPLFFLLIFR